MENFEVNAAPLLNPYREARRAGLGRVETDQQVAAHRLRARGFSYRRIAETLRIGYGTVSGWLYADAPVAEPTPAPVAKPQAASLADSFPLPILAHAAPATTQGGPELELRVAMLEAALSRMQRETTRREAELLAELDSLRGALTAASGAGGSLARLLRWSRGREPA